MSAPREPIAVTILGKTYRVACEPGEEDDLVQAARFLDGRMREIRISGKVIGTDRIAVIAALNIAHDLLSQKDRQNSGESTANKRIRALRERIEIALNDSTQLEL